MTNQSHFSPIVFFGGSEIQQYEVTGYSVYHDHYFNRSQLKLEAVVSMRHSRNDLLRKMCELFTIKELLELILFRLKKRGQAGK